METRQINEHVYSPEGRRDRQTGRQTNKQTMTTQSNSTKEMTKMNKILLYSYIIVKRNADTILTASDLV